jgi:hypothetical protein
MSTGVSGALGSPAPAMASAVSGRPSRSSDRYRPPLTCARGFILSSACLLLAVHRHFCPRTAEALRIPSGFRPPSRHKRAESTGRQSSQALPSFRPQRFSRSRRFAPRHTVRACFIPLPRPRFSPQGLPPTVSRLALTSAFPHDVSTACLHRGCPRCPSSRRPSSGR